MLPLQKLTNFYSIVDQYWKQLEEVVLEKC